MCPYMLQIEGINSLKARLVAKEQLHSPLQPIEESVDMIIRDFNQGGVALAASVLL